MFGELLWRLLQRTEWLCNTVFTYPDIRDKGTSLVNEVTNSEIGPLWGECSFLFHVPNTSKSLGKIFFLLICDDDMIRFSQTPCLSVEKFNVLNYLIIELLNKRHRRAQGQGSTHSGAAGCPSPPPPLLFRLPQCFQSLCDSPGKYFVLFFHTG